MVVEFTEFKGNKIIVLKKTPEDKFGFSFGKGKAKMILENLEEIKKFAAEE